MSSIGGGQASTRRGVGETPDRTARALDKVGLREETLGVVTPYREPPAGAPDADVVSFELPRPSLLTEYTILFGASLVLSVGSLLMHGPTAYALLWPPFAGLLAWTSLGAVRATKLLVRATNQGFTVDFEQQPTLRAAERGTFTGRASVSLELEPVPVIRGWAAWQAILRRGSLRSPVPTSGAPEASSGFSVLHLVVDGRRVLGLELVRDASREALVRERVRAFNASAAVLAHRDASAGIVRFLLALQTDDLARVIPLFSDGLALDATHEEDSLVEHAALAGAPRVLAKLLELGAKPSARALAVAAWNAPAHDAMARARHVACAELLLAAGVPLDAPAVDAGTAREAFAHAGEPFTTMAARSDAARARSAPGGH